MPPCWSQRYDRHPQYRRHPALRQSAAHTSAHSAPTIETPAPPPPPSSRQSAPCPKRCTPAPQRTEQTHPVAASYSYPSESPPSLPPASTRSVLVQNRLYG